jgi:hypothetical protein
MAAKRKQYRSAYRNETSKMQHARESIERMENENESKRRKHRKRQYISVIETENHVENQSGEMKMAR